MDDRLEKVAAAIEAAWNKSRDLPPIDFVERERMELAQAAIDAIADDLRLAGVKEGLEMAASGERPDDDLLEPHLPERIKSEKRCGIQQSDWLPGWYVPWSPRNDNQNAEGPWSHWVALAHEILAADQAAIRAIPVKADDRERA